MSKHLVIVESPAKAKTIEKYLGKDFTVLSSIGHIRSIAKKGKDGKPGKDKEVAGLAGIVGRMISPELISEGYFKAMLNKIEEAQQTTESSQSLLTEIEEEQSGE